jgi:hypothetical protein
MAANTIYQLASSGLRKAPRLRGDGQPKAKVRRRKSGILFSRGDRHVVTMAARARQRSSAVIATYKVR